VHRGAPCAEFRAHYRPTGDAFIPAPGSLEYFLTARYCLYVAGANGSTWRAEIHHPPWQLQPAEAEIRLNTMAAAHGIQLPDAAPHLLFARWLEVVVWLPERVTIDR
jgi:uncharacterized protein YqjF (DUF2071 family)